jgi:hypothetical protein
VGHRGGHAFERLGLKPEQYNKPGFNLLKHFGLTSKRDARRLNDRGRSAA